MKKFNETKIGVWWNKLDPSYKGLVIIGIICIIGIIIRWKHVLSGIARGFGHYSGYAD
ncbi:MAG: hypothetical protein LKM37_07750 [Bacteroidales bacterium]|jgi:hypothetical protein|nr:hypothetical protein [Bacteroidales bacterium]